jgi:prepilin-type processing-associated H-X9-DG protein
MSNLKQISHAWLMYSHDWDGSLCPREVGKASDGNLHPWAWLLRDYLALSMSGDNIIFRKSKVLNCPSLSLGREAPGNGQSTPYGMRYYGMGGGAWGSGYPAFTIDSQLKEPSRQIVFMDTINLPATDSGWYYCTYSGETNYNPVTHAIGKLHFRHQEHANVAFADGHVQALNYGTLIEPYTGAKWLTSAFWGWPR